MNVPKVMDPQPLFDVMIRIEYASNRDRPSLLRDWTAVLADLMPQMDLTPSSDDQPVPVVRFFDEVLSVAVHDSMIAVRTMAEYPGWDTVRSRMSDVLKKASRDVLGIATVTKISMNYLNYFRQSATMEEVVTAGSFWPESLRRDRTSLRHAWQPRAATECGHEVIIGDGVTFHSEDERGVILDITAWTEQDVPISDSQAILDQLDRVHSYEKRLFAALVQPALLATTTKEWEDCDDD